MREVSEVATNKDASEAERPWFSAKGGESETEKRAAISSARKLTACLGSSLPSEYPKNYLPSSLKNLAGIWTTDDLKLRC